MTRYEAEQSILKAHVDGCILKDDQYGYTVATTEPCIRHQQKTNQHNIVAIYRFHVFKDERGGSSKCLQSVQVFDAVRN
tara:strand:+ start:2482 stop:2718 length:237 start_codon:yes stop_codon:yes gene_type:complete